VRYSARPCQCFVYLVDLQVPRLPWSHLVFFVCLTKLSMASLVDVLDHRDDQRQAVQVKVGERVDARRVECVANTHAAAERRRVHGERKVKRLKKREATRRARGRGRRSNAKERAQCSWS